MIEIQIHNFFLVYVLICLGAAAVLSIFDIFKKNNMQEFSSGDDLCACPACDWIFLSRNKTTVRCPKCAAVFEVKRSKQAS